MCVRLYVMENEYTTTEGTSCCARIQMGDEIPPLKNTRKDRPAAPKHHHEYIRVQMTDLITESYWLSTDVIK